MLIRIILASCLTLIFSNLVAATTSNPYQTPDCNPQTNGFWCAESDTCVALYAQCDGTPDCPNGEDEKVCPDCKAENAEQLESVGKFYCPASDDEGEQCIDLGWKCDGAEDCPGGEDEQQCDLQSCTHEEFKCSNQQCIDLSWRCDGQPDCNDNSDEKDCEEVSKQCPEFQCDDGTCLSNSWLCDQEDDCAGGEDERDCKPQECPDDKRICHELDNKNVTRCVTARWFCDGEVDCFGGMDEQNCENTSPDTQGITDSCAEALEFTCASGECVFKAYKCDGEPDCEDGSDEDPQLAGCPVTLECRPGEFKCSDNSRCIPDLLKCSGKAECGDGSDESDCFSCETGLYCKTDSDVREQCIPAKELCDGKPFCADGTDEQRCNQTNPCESLSCNENESCQNISVDGVALYPTCVCKPGFRKNEDGSCVDDDECSRNPPVCDQICKNTVGSYHCECMPGYLLHSHNDSTSCKVIGSEHAQLLFTNKHDIRSMHMHEFHTEYMPLLDSKAAVAIDFDIEQETVFYSDATEQRIYRFNMVPEGSESGPNPVALDIPDVVNPNGLAYDWVYKHLYWTDTSTNTVNMACTESNHSYRRVLYSNEKENCATNGTVNRLGNVNDVCIDEPRALALHPKKGWMFWSDRGVNSHIVKANMDGSKMEKIAYNNEFHTYVLSPNGITLDLNGNDDRLFWIDGKLSSIYSCLIDNCMDTIKIVHYDQQQIKQPYSITVFEAKLLWSDWEMNGLMTALKTPEGEVSQILDHLDQPMDLKVYHQVSQPRAINYCGQQAADAKCEQICVPKPWMKFIGDDHRLGSDYSEPRVGEQTQCLCGDEYVLNADKRTCTLLHPLPVDHAVSSSDNQHGHSAAKSGLSLGVIAGIASSALLIVGLSVGLSLFLIARRVKAKKTRAMNFDNPIYKRTTEDRLELPHNEYQPDQSLPPSMIPLTRAENPIDSNEDLNV